MVETSLIKIARFLAPRYFEEFDLRVNQRVAKIISEMDTFEPLMKEFHGVFGKEWEHPEEKLDDRSKTTMLMWAYGQSHDPHFKHITDWVMNTQGNETLKRAPVTAERVLYGRAQISTMILFVKEVGRLSLLYEEMMEKNKPENFTSETNE